MYDQLIARGDIDASFNWDESFFQERKYDTAEIGAQELKDFAYGANLHINFFENYNLRSGHYAKAVELFRDILRVYPGHLAAQICLARALRNLGLAAEADEAAALAERLVERGEPIAVEQLARHPQLFPSFTVPPGVELAASWPRGGMPTAARAAI
jgi:tetratricopeptide (TPR) repeat protein